MTNIYNIVKEYLKTIKADGLVDYCGPCHCSFMAKNLMQCKGNTMKYCHPAKFVSQIEFCQYHNAYKCATCAVANRCNPEGLQLIPLKEYE